MIDLAIVGGGPAGLATALHAHRAGLAAVVLEPRVGPVDKACGEGLMPGAVAALEELGVDPVGFPLHGIRYLAGRHRAEADFAGGVGRGVRRTTLHTAMSAAVEAAGVPVLRQAVQRVSQDATGVRVDDLRARFLVAADGLHSPLRRMLALDRPTPPPRRFGQRRHFAVPPWTSYVEVHWGPATEAYVTPVADDLVGVALLTERRASYDDLLALFPALCERLDGARGGEVRGAGPLHQRARRRTAGRVLLVGDAGGYVDALTGEGVALAAAQAREAVAAVVAGRPELYERSWRRVSRRYRGLTLGLVHATRRPVLRSALVPVAQHAPAVFAGVVNALARPA